MGVFIIRHFNAAYMRQYQGDIQWALQSDFRRGVTIMRETHYCTSVFLGAFVQADILVTGDPDENYYNNPLRYYSAWGSYDVDQEILQCMNEYKLLKPLALLYKH